MGQSTPHQWWEIIVGILSIPAAIIGLFYTFVLIKKTLLEARKTKLEILEKEFHGKKNQPKDSLNNSSENEVEIPDVPIYTGLDLVEDVEGAHTGQYARFGAGLESSIRLWVIVSNGDRDVYDCQALLEDFEFSGDSSRNTWVNVSSGFERKAMKLDNANIPQNGKATLEIARANRKHPNINMQLSYLDGYSSSTCILEGEYRVTLRLRGNVLVNNQKTPAKNQRFMITFKYQNLPLLKITNIQKE